MNNKAEIYFTSIYNPYAVLEASSEISYYIDQEKLNNVSKLTKQALDGSSKDANNERYLGINEIIKTENNRYNSSFNINFYFVNSKKVLMLFLKSKKMIIKNYVNTRLKELKFDILSNYVDYLDSHPSEDGHKLLFSNHKNLDIGNKMIISKKSNKKTITIINFLAVSLVLMGLPFIFLSKTKNKVG